MADLADVQPFTDLPDLLKSDPANPAVRRRLKKTAVVTAADANLRIAALHALELAPPKQDVLQVALVLIAGPVTSDDQRWITQNGVAALSRLDLPEAKTALAQIQAPSTQSDAANALAASGKGG